MKERGGSVCVWEREREERDTEGKCVREREWVTVGKHRMRKRECC